MSAIALSKPLPSGTRLTGSSKWAARAIWLLIALPLFGLQIAVAKPYFETLRTVCRPAAETCFEEQLSLGSVAALHSGGVSPSGYAVSIWLSTVLSLIVWQGIGILLMFFRSDDWMALLVSLFLIVFCGATFASGLLDYAAFANPGLRPFVIGAGILGELLITAFFLLFPNGQLVPRWLAWLLIVRPVVAVTDYLPGLTISGPVYYVIFVTPILLLILAQVYRYVRVSTDDEKRQTRWVLFGVVLGVASFLIILFVDAVTGAWMERITRAWLLFGLLGQLAMAAIPISIAVAMSRSKLWDIDIVIRRTTSYAILTGLLLLVYFGSVVVLQRLLSPITGESTIAVVLSTLLIAALFLPLRRRVQAVIDRRFFRQKYNAEQVLAQFATTVRDETDLDALTAELVRVIQETMQPEFVSVWLAPARNQASGEEV